MSNYMNQVVVEKISGEGFKAIYKVISIHSRSGKDFGNFKNATKARKGDDKVLEVHPSKIIKKDQLIRWDGDLI